MRSDPQRNHLQVGPRGRMPCSMAAVQAQRGEQPERGQHGGEHEHGAEPSGEGAGGEAEGDDGQGRSRRAAKLAEHVCF